VDVRRRGTVGAGVQCSLGGWARPRLSHEIAEQWLDTQVLIKHSVDSELYLGTNRMNLFEQVVANFFVRYDSKSIKVCPSFCKFLS
jgi:hypothetical protein